MWKNIDGSVRFGSFCVTILSAQDASDEGAFCVFLIMRRLNNGFYQGQAWQRCRASYIASVGGLCERCLERGIINAGRVVHHIKHLTEENCTDPKIAYGFDNLKLLCQSCHEEIHRGIKNYKFDAQGNIIEKNRR